jgi:hypothetical protein
MNEADFEKKRYDALMRYCETLANFSNESATALEKEGFDDQQVALIMRNAVVRHVNILHTVIAQSPDHMLDALEQTVDMLTGDCNDIIEQMHKILNKKKMN